MALASPQSGDPSVRRGASNDRIVFSVSLRLIVRNFLPPASSTWQMTPRQLGDLIDRLGPALVLYARQWTAAPEDVVQDAFLKLVEVRRPPDDPAAWLFTVVRNRAMDLIKADRRRAKREQVARLDRWFVEPEIDGLDAERAVAALERLPAELREVIVARLWGGLTFDQIAAVSGGSASSAFRRYEAGIAALRETLGVPCPTDPTR